MGIFREVKAVSLNEGNIGYEEGEAVIRQES